MDVMNSGVLVCWESYYKVLTIATLHTILRAGYTFVKVMSYHTFDFCDGLASRYHIFAHRDIQLFASNAIIKQVS